MESRRESRLAEAVDALPVLDTALFDELWESLGRQVPRMHRIRDAFLATARGLPPLLESGETAAVRRELHTLVGSSGMIGARQVERLALELQAAARQDRRDDLDDLKRPLQRAIRDFEREFDRRLAAASAP